MEIASRMDAARGRARTQRRSAAAWKPVDLPTLEERYAELEKLVQVMIRELPKLRAEIERLSAENEELRGRGGGAKQGEE